MTMSSGMAAPTENVAADVRAAFRSAGDGSSGLLGAAVLCLGFDRFVHKWTNVSIYGAMEWRGVGCRRRPAHGIQAVAVGSEAERLRIGRVSSFVATMGSATMRLTAAMRSTACLGATAVEGFGNTQQPIESAFTLSGSSSPVGGSCSADDLHRSNLVRSAGADVPDAPQHCWFSLARIRCGSASAGGITPPRTAGRRRRRP